MVQITSVPPVAAASASAGSDSAHYMTHDLRRDVLVHCHDNADHKGLDETSTNVRALVWFPRMRRYINYHYDSCAYCTAKRKAAPPDSNAVTAARRLKLVEFDHKLLPPEIVGAAGAAAVLTIVDVVSRVTVFVPVPDLTAVTTARTLYSRWYSLFGVPTVFRCDGHPSFTSAVMKRFHSILGVRHVDFSAPDNATHHAVVERRNKVLEKFIDVGVSKGDILNAADLELYCASAAASCNLEHIYNGHTVLEYLTGEVPRTHRDTVTPAALEAAAGDMDDAFLAKLRSVLNASNTLLQHARDDRARENALARASAASPKHFTQFDLVPGDQVSYGGEVYVLLDTHETLPGVPATAILRKAAHDDVQTITVKYADVRPLTDPRASRSFHSVSDPATSVNPGDFVFFSRNGDTQVYAGVVQYVTDDRSEVSVHEYRQAPKQHTRFSPLYTNALRNVKQVSLAPKAHHTAVVHDVPSGSVILSGSISDSFHIDPALLDLLRSKGVADQ